MTDSKNLQPGDPMPLCTEAPAVRVRDTKECFEPPGSEGYTSPGHVKHFLPDREVNLAKLNKALADVYGEPALRGLRLGLEIDEYYWKQVCSDPWSGNAYRYAFRSPDIPINELEALRAQVQTLSQQVLELQQQLQQSGG